MATAEQLSNSKAFNSLSIEPELGISKKVVGIPEERQGNVRGWGEMSYYLGQMFPDTEKICLKFARSYFNAERFLAEGKPKRARRRFESLGKIKGYYEFEDENKMILKTIDVAVKGKSNQEDF